MQCTIGKLFILSAPSGAGKSTLVQALVNKMPGELERVKTYTTKAPSANASDEEYHFITVDQFQGLADQGFFMEWSTAYGTYYGSPRSVLKGLAQGKSYIVILDRAGAKAVKALYPDACLIWLYTTSIATLAERLKNRNRDTSQSIARRLALAHDETTQEAHEQLYDYHIANDDFQLALEELEKTVCAQAFGEKSKAILYRLAAQDRA